MSDPADILHPDALVDIVSLCADVEHALRRFGHSPTGDVIVREGTIDGARAVYWIDTCRSFAADGTWMDTSREQTVQAPIVAMREMWESVYRDAGGRRCLRVGVYSVDAKGVTITVERLPTAREE